MSSRKLKLAKRSAPVSALIALLLTLAIVGPSLAYTERVTGTVGPHSIRDTASNHSLTCRYKDVTASEPGMDWVGRLRWLDVLPPRMRASSGTQTVGWQFIVQRAPGDQGHDYLFLYGPWVKTYTSPIQRATATTTSNASFSPMSINVVVPTASWDDEPPYLYRVFVKMLWYGADGTVRGTAKDLLDWHTEVWPGYSGGAPGSSRQYCSAWHAF